MDYQEFTGKNIEEAILKAKLEFKVGQEQLDIVELEKGSNGIFGFGAKPAKIKAKLREQQVKAEQKEEAVQTETKIEAVVEKKVVKENQKSTEEVIREFLTQVFEAMQIEAKIDVNVHEDMADVELSGKEMGILIGKRGQTLDSLQYLLSLVVNKNSESYIKVKVDTENYRQRRRETLENLARNIAFKVKRTKRAVSLEPMNPFERRVIHSALQNDKYVVTKSEGEEPYRHVVVSLKK